MLIIIGLALIIVAVFLAGNTKMLFTPILFLGLGVGFFLAGFINLRLTDEISESQYKDMILNPYMIEYAKEKKFFDDGIITVNEYMSIPRNGVRPNRNKVLEMSSK